MKKYMLLVIIILACLVMASCMADRTIRGITPDANGEKTRISFMSSWGGVDSKAEALKEIFKRFQRDNPNIEIINESLFGEDFLPKLKTDFASGQNPDVFGLWPGSDIRALIRAGKVADLTEIINKDPSWKQSFNSEMWSYTTYEGKIYGLPVETIFECLFINNDLFEKFGIKVPVNYEELKAAVTSFKQNGIIPIAYNTEAEGTYFYQNLVMMLAGKEAAEHPQSKGEYIDSSIKAMEYMKELYRLGAFPQNAFTLSNNERNILFRDKKAAMIVQGSWFIGNLKNSEATVELVPFPQFNEGKTAAGTMIYGLGCGNFHLSTAAWEGPEKEASLKLLRYLASRETAAFLAEQTGMLSSINIDSYRIKYSNLTEKGLNLLENAGEKIAPPDSFVDRTVWENCIAGNFPYILEGKKQPKDIWDEAILKGIIEK